MISRVLLLLFSGLTLEVLINTDNFRYPPYSKFEYVPTYAYMCHHQSWNETVAQFDVEAYAAAAVRADLSFW